jgi:hypothetical protein
VTILVDPAPFPEILTSQFPDGVGVTVTVGKGEGVTLGAGVGERKDAAVEKELADSTAGLVKSA